MPHHLFLMKAKPMRDLLQTALSIYPGHAASYYVLGIMYERVPGWPLSFGDNDYAVSLARKSIDANRAEIEAGKEDEVKLTYHIELARHLHARDWSEKKRTREHGKKAERYRETNAILEKSFYYEGVVDIPEMDDGQEAVEVMRWVIDRYEAKPELSRSDREDLAEAREDFTNWTD